MRIAEISCVSGHKLWLLFKRHVVQVTVLLGHNGAGLKGVEDHHEEANRLMLALKLAEKLDEVCDGFCFFFLAIEAQQYNMSLFIVIETVLKRYDVIPRMLSLKIY
jgi:hypothetical protein